MVSAVPFPSPAGEVPYTSVLDSAQKGANYANTLFDIAKQRALFQQQQKSYQSQMQAGQAFAGGDYSGASGALAQGGDLPGAEQTQNYGIQQHQMQMQYLQRAVPVFEAAYAQGTQAGGPQGGQQAVLQAFDHLTPELQQLGISPQMSQQLRQQLASDPQGTLKAVGSIALKNFQYTTDPAGNIHVIDQVTGQEDHVIPGQHMPMAVPAGSSLYIPGSDASGAAASAGAPHAGNPSPAAQQVDYGDFAARMNGLENNTGNPSAQNPRSSATGDGQFINSTWLQTVRAAHPEWAKLSDEQLLALRSSPGLSNEMTAASAKANGTQLAAAGHSVGMTELGIAHRFGVQGALAILNADPNTPMSRLVPSQVIQANPGLANQTAGQVRQTLGSQIGGNAQSGGLSTQSLPGGGTLVRNAQTLWRDPTGQERTAGIAQVNTATGEKKFMTQAQMSAANMAPLQQVMRDYPNLHGQDFLSKLSPTDAVEVQAFAQGRGTQFSPMAMRSPAMKPLLDAVYQYNPQFDNSAVGRRVQAMKAFSTGKQGDELAALNTAIQHLALLRNLTAALGNGNVPLANSLRQTFEQQTGNPAPTNFDSAKTAVGNEVSKVTAGVSGGEGDRAKIQGPLNRAGSPQQLLGVMNTYTQLMAGRVAARQKQYEFATGNKDFASMLAPETLLALRAVQPRGNGNPPRQGQIIRYDANGNRLQ